jgi:AcrR family transcriptional regulator
MTEAAAKPSLRDRQRELTRQSIFDATLAAFGEKGYSLVTVDDIVSLAGVSRATFYLHFDSKAAVLRALRQQRIEAWPTEHNPQWGTSERASIKAFFERMVDFYLETPMLHKALHEARAADPEFASEHRELLDMMAADWKSSQGKKDVDPARARIVILMMYTLLDYFMYLWLIQGWELDRGEAVDAMTEALFAVWH